MQKRSGIFVCHVCDEAFYAVIDEVENRRRVVDVPWFHLLPEGRQPRGTLPGSNNSHGRGQGKGDSHKKSISSGTISRLPRQQGCQDGRWGGCPESGQATGL